MNRNLIHKLNNALNEMDVQSAYREALDHGFQNPEITSPYGSDGLLVKKLIEKKSVRMLLEFKNNKNLKEKIEQANVLIQLLYYLKKFENNGQKFPNVLFVGDKNECFAIHTNAIIKYLSKEIDWTIAPSTAHKSNPHIIRAMVDDVDILPFVYNIDDNFDFKEVIEGIKYLATNVIYKIRITKNNIMTIFDYFNKEVLNKNIKLGVNEKVNLFIQIIINSEENFLHPKKKNILITKSFGNLKVYTNKFNSFFAHFNGDDYSPKEKEGLTGVVDRLIEDETRRMKGEFFTPSAWVDEAHKMIGETFGEDWKEKYIVWDCAWGTGNLTRDYKFKELYCSTIEQSDIDTANQMNYNLEATKFQFDFLNDSFNKLPVKLKEHIDNGDEIIFFINPPYGRSNSNGKNKLGTIEKGSGNTVIGDEMRKIKLGGASSQLYTQFLYRISKIKNTNIVCFTMPLYKTGNSYKKFRKHFYSKFQYEQGMLFNASHFSDTANTWGIDFSIWKCGIETKSNLNIIIKDIGLNGIFYIKEKNIYNLDNDNTLTKYNKFKFNIIDFPKFSSFINVKETQYGYGIDKESFGTLVSHTNAVYKNNTNVYLVSGGVTENVNKLFINKKTFVNVVSTFTARRTIKRNWYNYTDEYFAPNDEHPEWKQFVKDSIIYSLFNNKSYQSSLRQVEYKDKQWNIKNEFFWMSVEEMKELANKHDFDEMYQDARTDTDRFVYNKLNGLELSDDAFEILEMGKDLVRKSMEFRCMVHEGHERYHLNAWDAGYAQLKLIWKEYMSEDFKAFRKKYKKFEERLIPLVYELGFLKK